VDDDDLKSACAETCERSDVSWEQIDARTERLLARFDLLIARPNASVKT
jgi:hypothetical protein